MTIIDQNTWTSYPNLTIKQAAVLIGVAQITIYRWKKCGKKQEYNHLLIIFKEENVN
jgi:predicted site-specific integrase-resolvase